MSNDRKPALSMAKLRLLRKKERLAGVPYLRPTAKRPATYAECARFARPCPFVSCRHHLFLNVKTNGTLQFPFGDDVEALRTMLATCSLDVAKEGPKPDVDVGPYVALSLNSVRRVEMSAMAALRELAKFKEDGVSEGLK